MLFAPDRGSDFQIPPMKNLKLIPLKTLIGLAALFLVWLALAWVVFSRAPFTLMTIFWVAASWIIIFVPLWRKVSADSEKSKSNGCK